MEVTNRFKGLGLIYRVPEKLWMTVHNVVQDSVTKTIPKKKKSKKTKWFSEDALQIAKKRRDAKRQRRKGYTQLNAGLQRTARRDKKVFLSEQCKEIEEDNRVGKLEISSRKLEMPREHFTQR